MRHTVKARLANRRDVTTNPAALLAFRGLLVARNFSAARHQPAAAFQYLLRSREVTNLTYEIQNLSELISTVAYVLNEDRGTIQRYVDELRSDEAFRTTLRRKLSARRNRDSEPRYGKRNAIYSLVRATRPRVVVETGTYDGLGTAVIARALERNRDEGAPGHVHTLDINPNSGWLLDPASPIITRHIGDASRTLPIAVADGVDFLIHDSLKTYSHERWGRSNASSITARMPSINGLNFANRSSHPQFMYRTRPPAAKKS